MIEPVSTPLGDADKLVRLTAKELKAMSNNDLTKLAFELGVLPVQEIPTERDALLRVLSSAASRIG